MPSKISPVPENSENTYKKISVNLKFLSLGLSGLLFLFMFSLVVLSKKFQYDIPLSQKPIIVFVSILFLAGIVYLAIIYFIKKQAFLQLSLVAILVFGLTLRLSMFISTPVLEDDFYRYLWDGACLANRINPFLYSPQEILDAAESEKKLPTKILELSKESGEIINRINHPYVRTIYPFITQMFFALSYLIHPWDITAWRLILLIIDVLNFFLLLKILQKNKDSIQWLIIYWWNPLIINEIFNSGHMDILIFPFLLSSLLFLAKKREIISTAFLALACGVKIWPAIYFPLILKPVLRKPLKAILVVSVFTVIIFTLFAPTQFYIHPESSAFANYSQRWELNDSIFKIILWLNQIFLNLLEIHSGHAQLTSRIFVFTLIMAFTLVLIFKKTYSENQIYRQGLFIISAIFLLSPTQFPWYYIWLLPFLTIQPKFSLLALTPLLSLYYLRYYFAALGNVQLFDYGIVWLEFIPIWILLIWESFAKNSPILTDIKGVKTK